MTLAMQFAISRYFFLLVTYSSLAAIDIREPHENSLMGKSIYLQSELFIQ